MPTPVVFMACIQFSKESQHNEKCQLICALIMSICNSLGRVKAYEIKAIEFTSRIIIIIPRKNYRQKLIIS